MRRSRSQFLTSAEEGKPLKNPVSAATRKRWHIFGFIFMFFALLALIWDGYNLTKGLGLASFSGVVDLWVHLDSVSLHHFEAYIIETLGAFYWQNIFYPVLNFPAVIVFAVAGGLYLRAGRPDIALREPSMMELKLVQQGYDPRKELRNRGMSVGS